MLKLSDLKPLQRHALLAALESPQHRFNRTRAGYVPANANATELPAFTYRLMRMMERDYLVTFDSADFPSFATLTSPGLAMAQALRAAASTRTGAA